MWCPSRLRPLAGAALLFASTAFADSVDASATTLLQGRQDWRDGSVHTVVPTLELVSARASDVDNPYVSGLSVVLSGWGGLEGGDPLSGGLAQGDVDLAYLEGSVLDRSLQLRLGRQLVVGGAAHVVAIDGLDVTWKITSKLGVTIYGGEVVVPKFALPRGDAVAGGRVFYKMSIDTEVGASYIDILSQGLQARMDTALDGRWSPRPDVSLSAFGAFSLLAYRLDEADVAANWTPTGKLQVTVDYRRTAPDLFIPQNSIFSVFAEEREDEGGLAVVYRPWRRISLLADDHVISTQDGWGDRAQARFTWSLDARNQTNVGIEYRGLYIPVNGYSEVRAFAIHHVVANLFATLDLDAYRFREAINGEFQSYTGTATVVWDFTRTWRAALSGVLGQTPYLSYTTQVMARLVWSPTFSFRETHP
jgi:hypothetical protein